MSFVKVISFFAATAILSGCATYRAQNCSENAGHEKGMNDARMGRLMAMGQFATMCPDKDVEAAQRGYKAGYEAGKKSAGTPQLNLSFKKGKIGLEGAYKCQLGHQGESFFNQAASESQARNNVLGLCQKKFKVCNERDISCSN
jgi:hypothetical protein